MRSARNKAKVWYVKMPHFAQLGDTSLIAPELVRLEDDEQDLTEYMDPVMCLPDQYDPLLLDERKR